MSSSIDRAASSASSSAQTMLRWMGRCLALCIAVLGPPAQADYFPDTMDLDINEVLTGSNPAEVMQAIIRAFHKNQSRLLHRAMVGPAIEQYGSAEAMEKVRSSLPKELGKAHFEQTYVGLEPTKYLQDSPPLSKIYEVVVTKFDPDNPDRKIRGVFESTGLWLEKNVDGRAFPVSRKLYRAYEFSIDPK